MQGAVEDKSEEDKRNRVIKEHIDAIIDLQRDEEGRNDSEEDGNEDAKNNKRYEEVEQLEEDLVKKVVKENVVRFLEENVVREKNHEDLETIIDDELDGDDDENEEEVFGK